MMRRGVVALQVWASCDSNPFLQRALRIETRKHKPLLTVLAVVLCVCVTVIAGWFLWSLGGDSTARGTPPAGALRPFGPVARAVGGNPIGLAAILAVAVCGYGAVRVARARAAYLLRQEVLKGTLEQLQLLPIAEERWLWMMSAHLTGLAMLVGAVGLPLYMLALYTGQWSLRDLIGLVLVFLMLGQVLPSWQPQLWKQRAGRHARGREDLKLLQSAARLARGDLDPAVLKPAQMTAAQRLEMQRRTQRALSGLTAANPPAAEAQATAAAPEQPAVKRSSKQQTVGAGSAGSGNFGTIFSWFSAWMVFNSVMSSMRLGSGLPGVALRSLWRDLPHDITALAPALPITWPLLIARLLVTPLPFFALALPPAILVLPLWVGALQQRYTALAALVSSRETFWTPRRARQRAALHTTGLILGLLIFWGYGWRTLITSGTLGGLLAGAPLATDWAVAALWSVALVGAAIAAASRLERALARAYSEEISLDSANGLAARGVALALASAVGLYFGGCWMGGETGISPAWQDRLVPTVATTAAFLTARFGIFSLQAVLRGGLRKAVHAVYWLWWLGLAGAALLYIVYGWVRGAPFSFEQAPYVVLSPFVTLLALFRYQLSRPTAQWWWGPLAQILIGAACLLVVGTLRVSSAVKAGALPELAARPDSRLWSDVLVAPALAVLRLMQRIVVQVVQVGERIGQALRGVNERIIRIASRADNPVLSTELRRRAQREQWSLQLLLLLGLEAILFVFIADPGTLIGRSWYQPSVLSTPVNPGDWGYHMVLGVLVPALFVTALSTFSIGQTFDRERANGTLLFLYLTPMTDAAILMGKLLPGLCYGALLLTTAVPWLLVGCLAGVVGGAPMVALLAVFGTLYLLSTWVYIGYASIFFAIRATKPAQGGGEAFFWIAGLESLAVSLIIWAGVLLFPGYNNLEALVMVIGAALLTVLHGILTPLAWQLARAALRRQRYGDVLEKRPAWWQAIAAKLLRRRRPTPHTSAQ